MTIVPDSNIRKTAVPTTSLPELTKNGEYILRYRIISEDGSKTSSWSPHRIVQTTPISSNVSTDITILNPLGSEPPEDPKYTVAYEAKSHGKSFDFSWKINNTVTDLIEIPASLKNSSYDSYVRWGTIVSSASLVSGQTYSITTQLLPNVPTQEIIALEDLSDGTKITLKTSSDSLETNIFTAVLIDTIPVGKTISDFTMMWTPWEYISTTRSNSFSVPIPTSHQSTIVLEGYAEFIVHVATTTKDLDEYNYQTLLLYSEHLSTRGVYDSTSLS